jgi:hypothetical protein
MERGFWQLKSTLIKGLLSLSIGAEVAGGWDFNPGFNYLSSPQFHLSYRKGPPGKFNPYLFSLKIPKNFNGKVMDLQFQQGNYPLYTLLTALQYLDQMGLALLLRLESHYHPRRPYHQLENFLAYLYLKLHSTLAPLRRRKIWREVDQGARFLIGESISLYNRGKRASWQKRWWEVRRIFGELCRRQLLLIRILAGNPKCGCREFLKNSYTLLYYYCFNR